MKAIYALAAITIASPALAQPTSEEYALMGRKTFSLWSCTVLAGYSGNSAEAERLFNLGYETAKTFVEAVKDGKVKREDWGKHVPMLFGDMMGGPSIDFALGRMYELVQDHTGDELREIFKKTGATDDGSRKTQAHDMYGKQNCSFLR